ncbi:MAG: hypothetical protein ACKO96_41690 [Flammeovirgaceae bacterium]
MMLILFFSDESYLEHELFEAWILVVIVLMAAGYSFLLAILS